MPRWLLALALAAGAAYAYASHWLMSNAGGEAWAAAALLAPLALLVAGGVWRRSALAGLALLAVFGAALVLLARVGGASSVNRLYLVQHVAIHLVLLFAFARTLGAHDVSFVGRIARRIHGELTPAMRSYTHKVTWLWVGYFAGTAVASPLIYALCPFPVWSLLSNVGTPVLIASLFVGEYLLRYRLHPEFERASLVKGWQAMKDGS
jgi:uncharacterized membrane protein